MKRNNYKKMKKLLLMLILSSCQPQPLCDGVWLPEIKEYKGSTKYSFSLHYNGPDKEGVEHYLNETFFNRHDITIKFDGDINGPRIEVLEKDSKGCITGNLIQIDTDRTYTSTLAHEIGHRLGLSHLKELDYQNVMRAVESDCGKRIEFNQEQIIKIKNKL